MWIIALLVGIMAGQLISDKPKVVVMDKGEVVAEFTTRQDTVVVERKEDGEFQVTKVKKFPEYKKVEVVRSTAEAERWEGIKLVMGCKTCYEDQKVDPIAEIWTFKEEEK